MNIFNTSLQSKPNFQINNDLTCSQSNPVAQLFSRQKPIRGKELYEKLRSAISQTGSKNAPKMTKTNLETLEKNIDFLATKHQIAGVHAEVLRDMVKKALKNIPKT